MHAGVARARGVLVCGRRQNSGDSYALWRVMGTGARRGQRTTLVRGEALSCRRVGRMAAAAGGNAAASSDVTGGSKSSSVGAVRTHPTLAHSRARGMRGMGMGELRLPEWATFRPVGVRGERDSK